MKSVHTLAAPPEADFLDEIVSCIRAKKPVRRDLPDGGRLHIDRPLPFLCVHVADDDDEPVARAIAQANASYLVTANRTALQPLIETIAPVLKEMFGAFLLLDVGELEHDTPPSEDAPFLPAFDVRVWSTPDAATAADVFSTAVGRSKARFRRPLVQKQQKPPADAIARMARQSGCSAISVRFAPVYRQPDGTFYPELREILVAMMFDAALQAFASFIERHQSLTVSTHRALGRKAIVDAVTRVDRAIDEVAQSFDFLLTVTPINAEAAFDAFKAGGYRTEPVFLYRPLTVQIETAKRKLFAISFDHMEDPLLYNLYREKQQELDLQLSLIASRHTPRFVEFGRAIYGPVETQLLTEATTILQDLSDARSKTQELAPPDMDGLAVARQAADMIETYRKQYSSFDARIELRDDLPSGLMVSGNRLLISTDTSMDPHRVEPLLSHEIGVHLLTYFNGSAQGLRLFRSGLSGYEGMQEGLAVFAEYLSGGMTTERLRLIAGRVVGCAAMLDGASFAETFAILNRDHDFPEALAFNLVLRLYRGGRLAKDAIYLRGLLELLAHLGSGGALEPFWMGKIASSHFNVMEELASRGLLRQPVVRPLFLETAAGKHGMACARQGMRPIDMLQPRGE
ncbi:flavohemoglobin expression-modulating QEGLA motif protein [Rhizobium sp. S152]|uniref:flavohemoglobin expression-modulating QEGLA motif protein n=1 Tax=Rhizobium sp. S152 TaxID=3055038 RepID=UPI0025A9AF46|nr:flavohemoglobin expression-modulating QEGLA motif protein [Rhizobium sp. S152]MDM9625481.1 flavohemoglobin expression-modulating QEGLA motif protein [Rhizobium sp. S152]